MPTVLIADSQPLFAEALSTSLSDRPGFQVFGSKPRSGPDCVAAALRHRPDVCILEYWLPQMAGPAVANTILSALATKVVLLGWLFGPAEVQNGLSAGAAGFFPKDVSFADFMVGLSTVLEGKAPVLPSNLKPFNDLDKVNAGREVWGRLGSLGRREVEIVQELSRGRRVGDIATAMSISPATVRTHVSNILRKLDVRTQSEAVALCRRYELIPA